jgi:hypothetical protein
MSDIGQLRRVQEYPMRLFGDIGRSNIRAPRGDQVMLDNCLDAGPFSEMEVTKMLGLSKPVDLWLTYFLSLRAPATDSARQEDIREESGSSSGVSDEVVW